MERGVECIFASGGGVMSSERPEQNKQVRKLMVALVK
jgi:hypothetical protein